VTASPQLEVADVVRRFGARLLAVHGASLSREQRRVLACLAACRTAALGGHLYQCDRCGYEHPVYNSCRDRHCPKCQALASERWLGARTAELLPVPYFHLVATVPDALHGLFLQNQRALYDLLFRSVASSLLEVAADPRHLGARIGCLATLHTWNQVLLHHPHVHMIVPGGGLTVDGTRWVGADPKYLVPVQVLSRALRGRLLTGIKALHADGALGFHGKLEPLAEPRTLARHLEPLWHKEWVVYLKPPFAGPKRVLEYLARYTHRIALSNRRLVAIDDDTVTFRYRDRAHGDVARTLRLDGVEFLRRFLLHVLPRRFVRIRSYGLLANRNRTANLARCREALGIEPDDARNSEAAQETWQETAARLLGHDPFRCPACGQGRLAPVTEIRPHARPPPLGRPPP
jgi:predicted RNA-binding Zn-ribbon protein involved in translation (DUF1610 family)